MSSEHYYIFSSGKDVKLVDWGRDIQGREKPQALGWNSSRIIKTLFLQDGTPSIYGIVLPLDRKADMKVLADSLQIPKRTAKGLRLSETLPHLHRPHSIAPFICDKDLGLIGKIIFSPETCLDDPVDFSFPGRMDLSLHMGYLDAFQILEQRYQGLMDLGRVY